MFILDQWRSVFQNSGLTWRMAKREFASRYRGAVLGVLWSAMQPLALLAVYAVVFTLIFTPKWHVVGVHPSLIVFSGIVIHLFLSEVITQSSTAVSSNTSFIKKIVFPVEILPLVNTLSALIQFHISFLVLIVVVFLKTGGLSWTVVFFPVVMLPLIVFSCGVAWLFAAVGVFIKDISEISGLLSTLLLFTSGVLFPLTLVSVDYQFLFNLNPLTFIVHEMRNILLLGELPSFKNLFIHLFVSLIFSTACLVLFSKGRRFFADVM